MIAPIIRFAGNFKCTCLVHSDHLANLMLPDITTHIAACYKIENPIVLHQNLEYPTQIFLVVFELFRLLFALAVNSSIIFSGAYLYSGVRSLYSCFSEWIDGSFFMPSESKYLFGA